MSRPVIIGSIVFVIVVVVATGYYFATRKETPSVSCADMIPQPTIAAFGDSLIVGYGADTPGGFVTMLSQKVGLPITNLGRNGDTTAGALERIDTVTQIHPTIVLLLLSGNDALQKVPQTETQKNLSEIITRLQGSGSKVVLLGVLGSYPFSDPYSPMFESLAKQYKTPYVSNVLTGLIGNQDLMSDTVHPNEAGYRKIADRVYPVLEQACQSN